MAVENDHLFVKPSKEATEEKLKKFVLDRFFVPRESTQGSWYSHVVRFYYDDRIVFSFRVDSGKFNCKGRRDIPKEITEELKAELFLHGFDYFVVTTSYSDRQWLFYENGYNEAAYLAYREKQAVGLDKDVEVMVN